MEESCSEDSSEFESDEVSIAVACIANVVSRSQTAFLGRVTL